MVVDESGLVWIVEPMLALGATCLVLALALWCHGWIAAESAAWPLSTRARRLVRASLGLPRCRAGRGLGGGQRRLAGRRVLASQ